MCRLLSWHAQCNYLLISGVASDVEGTFSATINWNTVSDKSIVIPAQRHAACQRLDRVLSLLQVKAVTCMQVV